MIKIILIDLAKFKVRAQRIRMKGLRRIKKRIQGAIFIAKKAKTR